jgi:hypothetical protein
LSAGPRDEEPPEHAATDARTLYRVDAREADAVVVGDNNTQINYHYHKTWIDDIAESPLVSVSGAITSPYRGLSAFKEQDDALFFGRDAAVKAVLELMSRRIKGSGLVVVSGVSGAGKSSLLRAPGCSRGSEARAWRRRPRPRGGRVWCSRRRVDR